MEAINVKADIKTFITKNATNALPMYKFEFVPYVSIYEEKAQTERNENENDSTVTKMKEVIKNVRDFISNVFFNEQPTEADPNEAKVYNEIEVIVTNAWENNDILPNDWKSILAKHVKLRKNRRFLLTCINKFRLNGLFTLSEDSYNNIGDMLLLCLDEVLQEKDFESAKICINLSQSLYKTATEPNMPRVFLQSYVGKNDIWKSLSLWEDLIKCKLFV